MKVYPHRVNGKFYGCFYYLNNGQAAYLAHRKRREVFQAKNAWCIDLRTLEACKARGISVIGIVAKSGADKFFWIAPVDDFFGVHSFAHFGDTRQRGLPLSRFPINPGKCMKRIERSVKIR